MWNKIKKFFQRTIVKEVELTKEEEIQLIKRQAFYMANYADSFEDIKVIQKWENDKIRIILDK